jgi:hypothetical protein
MMRADEEKLRLLDTPLDYRREDKIISSIHENILVLIDTFSFSLSENT